METMNGIANNFIDSYPKCLFEFLFNTTEGLEGFFISEDNVKVRISNKNVRLNARKNAVRFFNGF